MSKITVYDTNGNVTGEIELPKAIFGAKVNEQLLAQAVRVYLSNQRQAKAKAKTRADVDSISSAKIWRQKGTGRARHGSRRAPIFVGGGVAHGPTGKENYKLSLPKKMRQKALVSALSGKAKEKTVWIVDDLRKLTGKTKEGKKMLETILKDKFKQGVLLALMKAEDKVKRAFSNLPKVELVTADNLTAYEVLKAGQLIIEKEGIALLVKRLKG